MTSAKSMSMKTWKSRNRRKLNSHGSLMVYLLGYATALKKDMKKALKILGASSMTS